MRWLSAVAGLLTTGGVLWILAYLVIRSIPGYTFGSESTAWEEVLGWVLLIVYAAGLCAAAYCPILAGGWVQRTMQRVVGS